MKQMHHGRQMNPDIRSKLKRIADIHTENDFEDPIACIDQICYLIYLKLLDEDEPNNEQFAGTTQGSENRNSLFPQQAERFRWKTWRDKCGDDLVSFLHAEVFPYMASLVKEAPQVAVYFRDARLEIVDSSVLKELIDEIDSIEFRNIEPGVDGGVIEYLFTNIRPSNRDFRSRTAPLRRGHFRTPRQIRALMVAMIDPDMGETVYDPACGTGGFLIDCVDHVLAKHSEVSTTAPTYGQELSDQTDSRSVEEASGTIPKLPVHRKGAGDKLPDLESLERSIYGFDVSRQMIRLATMDLLLHGVRRPRVRRANLLSRGGGLTEDDRKRRYDIVLSNPVFADDLRTDPMRSDLRTHGARGEVLFIEIMMNALAPGGRCAVMVPESILSRPTRAHGGLRKTIVETFDLLAVVSLPADVFKPYTAPKMSVLVFRRPCEGLKRTVEKVWFYELTNDDYVPEAMFGVDRLETPEKNYSSDFLTLWGNYQRSKFASPPGSPASTLLEAGSEVPSSWWTEVNILGVNGYNLVPSHYRPLIADPAPEEDPADLIRDALTLEGKIAKDLKALLSELENK